MSTMTSLSFGLVILLALSLAVVAALPDKEHFCNHDAPDLQRGIRHDTMQHPSTPQRYHSFKTQARDNIRVAISVEDLNNANQYCTAAGQRRPNFKGQTITCAEVDTLTEAKKAILINNILPAAKARIEELVKVDRATSNLIIPSTACSGGFTIPSSHGSTGVPNADYVLYVAAGQTPTGNLAFAGGCSTDQNGRIISGRANFGPRYIAWDNKTNQEEQVATAVHEIIHALGFTSSGFSSRTRSVSIRGKTATILAGTNVVAKTREYFNCQTLQGAEIEDEGSSGSAGSHFERRIFKDEIMAAAGGETVSPLILAALEDMGHYTPDYTKVGDMTFAKGAGCSYHTEKCNTAAGGRGTYWCFDPNGPNQCTHDYKAVGGCAISTFSTTLPSYFQYFSDPRVGGPQFLDGCPFIRAFSNRVCDNEPITATSTEQTFGFYFGSGGRCFDTTNFIKKGFNAGSISRGRCFQTRCVNSRIHFKVGSSAWIPCPATGDAGNITGVPEFDGIVHCPAAADMCSGLPASTATPGDTQPVTPAPPELGFGGTSVSIPSRDSRTKVAGSATFTGTSFATILATEQSATDLRSALLLDIAELVKVTTSNVALISLKAPSNFVIEFEITGQNKESVDAAFKAAIDAGGQSWMPNVNAEYLKSNPTDLPRLISFETSAETGLCSFLSETMENTTCYMIIGAVVILLVLIILFLCYKICCSGSDEDEPDQPKSSSRPVTPRNSTTPRNNKKFPVAKSPRNQSPGKKPSGAAAGNEPFEGGANGGAGKDGKQRKRRRSRSRSAPPKK